MLKQVLVQFDIPANQARRDLTAAFSVLDHIRN
jgi:hypothetical protein